MALMRKSPNDKGDNDYRVMALLGVVPAILIAAPLVGFFGGEWADERFGTDPYLKILGIVLGFASAGREIYRLVRKAEQMQKQDEDDQK